MISPSIVPSTTPSSVAAGAIRSTSREPASTREKTSRPFVSVPNGWPQVGGWLVGKLLSKIGSYGATSRGNIAQKIQKRITIAPITTLGDRSSSRNRSARAARDSERPVPGSGAGSGGNVPGVA